ncbi:phytochelatin synthase family protein [Shewanella sp. UCD-KL12]|uniref:phytochelatin synthase family protein n=1 Tax=Shewanella sp. UCD-KL12 TaxID=1917163 RepID=UPI0009707E59|nr:phytochelatin synthase family protein [Shewanella sp. UCD-KL12]
MNTIIRRSLITVLFFSIGYLVNNTPAFATSLVDWDSTEGIHRLSESKVKQDFFSLSPHFEGQENKVYCGVASMTIVLNALRVGKDEHIIASDQSIIAQDERVYFPQNGWSPLFNRYSQSTVVALSPKSKLEIMGKPSKDGGNDYGLSLSNLSGLATNHGLITQVFFANNLQDKTQQKAALISTLSAPHKYAIINYSRVVLNQAGSGHFSPVVAYDKDSDSFLIMDVSNTFQTWVWVESDALFNAMAKKDKDTSRGFVILSEA